MLDLNVKTRPSSTESERLMIMKRCYELGWDGIAWNNVVMNKLNHVKPIKAVITDNEFTDDSFHQRTLGGGTLQKKGERRLKQYSRITVYVSDVSEAQQLNLGNDILNSFDIVAACPVNAKVFSYLCKSAEIDIISIDFGHKVPFPIVKKLLDEAVSRQIFFEISYSSMLNNSSYRKEITAGSQVVTKFLRGRNIITSSGADQFNQVRGPFDVINICKLLNLSSEQGNASLNSSCEAVLQHASARKLRYIPAEICQRKQSSSQDMQSNTEGNKRLKK